MILILAVAALREFSLATSTRSRRAQVADELRGQQQKLEPQKCSRERRLRVNAVAALRLMTDGREAEVARHFSSFREIT